VATPARAANSPTEKRLTSALLTSTMVEVLP
jgi:hypothetical protein